ncbi:MAG: hypothetical protein ACK58T_12705, partial [Phycisphaerae bacterium]
LKRYSYDIASEAFRDPENKDLAVNGEKFDLVFGEPAGMAEHRRMLENYFKAKQERLNLQVEQK